MLSPDQYPPEGQEFFKDFTAEVRRGQPGPVRDLRLRGDESGAGRDQALRQRRREVIIKELFATKDRESVLGTYSIDENGDTTLTDYGVYADQGRRAGVRPDDQGRGGFLDGVRRPLLIREERAAFPPRWS